MSRQKKITDAFTETKSLAPAATSKGTKLPVKRKLIPDGNENSESRPSIECPAGAEVVAVGFEDSFQNAKRALHTSAPSKLPGREAQIEEVFNWLSYHLANKTGGAMYISGAPGTGKTAVVQHSIRKYEDVDAPENGNRKASGKKKQSFYSLSINCMSIVSPSQIYEDILKAIAVSSKSLKGDSIKEKLSNRFVKSTKATKMMLLVLDEMDQLLQGKGNEILYSLFEWARVPGSKLILIGIANALDLTVRHLPLLGISAKISNTSSSVRLNSKGAESKTNGGKRTVSDCVSNVEVINFPPYERTDIEKILEERLLEIGSRIFDPSAIKFVAAKVAASTGDMRKALNACKVALDAVEKQQRLVLKTTADDGFNFSSPKKLCMLQGKIGVTTVASVFGPKKDEGPLPLQQLVVLGALLKIYKIAPNSRYPKVDGVTSPVPMNVVYDEYRKICTAKGFSWIDRSEIGSICGMLQDRSLVTVVENMAGCGSKKSSSMNLKNKTGFMIDPKAVEKVLIQGQMNTIADV